MRHLFASLLWFTSSFAAGQQFKNTEPLAHTFSIVARDPKTGEMGVAVQSHWFSVGTALSWGHTFKKDLYIRLRAEFADQIARFPKCNIGHSSFLPNLEK